jgi:hypothetical protein
MARITHAQLSGYLDDALSEKETAQVEQALRQSEALRQELRQLMQESDRGEHSLGAIWRRQRLSCPTREQLGSYLLGGLDADWRDYILFHLHTVGCSYCLANLADLEARQKDSDSKARDRRRRLFQSSAGFLKPGRSKRK